MSPPMPMKTKTNSVIYYLYFASQKPVAAGIVDQIFDKYRKRPGALIWLQILKSNGQMRRGIL